MIIATLPRGDCGQKMGRRTMQEDIDVFLSHMVSTFYWLYFISVSFLQNVLSSHFISSNVFVYMVSLSPSKYEEPFQAFFILELPINILWSFQGPCFKPLSNSSLCINFLSCITIPDILHSRQPPAYCKSIHFNRQHFYRNFSGIIYLFSTFVKIISIYVHTVFSFGFLVISLIQTISLKDLIAFLARIILLFIFSHLCHIYQYRNSSTILIILSFI